MPLVCLFKRSDHRADETHKTPLTNNIMCWGIETVRICELCRSETADADINWQGCHLEASEVDSYPVCSAPIITQELWHCNCQVCLTEADDGGNPDDIYPEPFDHPGFPDTKPVIEVDRVQFPGPTTYESFQKVENLAGTADELPSYEDAMNELPEPPCWYLFTLRNAAVHEHVITEAVYTQAVEYHQKLMSVALSRRQNIREYQNKVPHHAAHTKALLDLAYERMESLLSQQEQTISRISSLQSHLKSAEKDINLEGPYFPSPSEMALLKYKREAIIRELEEKFIQRYKLATPEDWDLRIEKLLDHVANEWRAALDANVDELLSVEESRASSTTARASASSDQNN